MSYFGINIHAMTSFLDYSDNSCKNGNTAPLEVRFEVYELNARLTLLVYYCNYFKNIFANEMF